MREVKIMVKVDGKDEQLSDAVTENRKKARSALAWASLSVLVAIASLLVQVLT
jgi:hypothetical protein